MKKILIIGTSHALKFKNICTKHLGVELFVIASSQFSYLEHLYFHGNLFVDGMIVPMSEQIRQATIQLSDHGQLSLDCFSAIIFADMGFQYSFVEVQLFQKKFLPESCLDVFRMDNGDYFKSILDYDILSDDMTSEIIHENLGNSAGRIFNGKKFSTTQILFLAKSIFQGPIYLLPAWPKCAALLKDRSRPNLLLQGKMIELMRLTFDRFCRDRDIILIDRLSQYICPETNLTLDSASANDLSSFYANHTHQNSQVAMDIIELISGY